MMLTDAGVEYTVIDFEAREWLPILRVLAHHLGKYCGNNEDEAYELDSFVDMLNDFSLAWARSHWGDAADKAKSINEHQPRYLAGVERSLARREGPYILGHEISYADFKLQATLMNTKITSFYEYPHIKAFSEAIYARSGVAEYISTRV
jgi:glutathione S-transferase